MTTSTQVDIMRLVGNTEPEWAGMLDGTKYRYGTDDLPSMAVIATALSRLCRFNGHVSRFYSVLEHSYFVSIAYAAMFPHATIIEAKLALLHDAHECVLGDMVSPLKKTVVSRKYEELARAFDDALWQQEAPTLAWEGPREVPVPHDARSWVQARIKQADLAVLAVEAHRLQHPDVRKPATDGLVPDPKLVGVFDVYNWAHMTPDLQIREFLEHYRYLGGRRQ